MRYLQDVRTEGCFARSEPTARAAVGQGSVRAGRLDRGDHHRFGEQVLQQTVEEPALRAYRAEVPEHAHQQLQPGRGPAFPGDHPLLRTALVEGGLADRAQASLAVPAQSGPLGLRRLSRHGR